MVTCKQCSKEFVPKRSTAVFCSDPCRVKASRGTIKINEGESISTVADEVQKAISNVEELNGTFTITVELTGESKSILDFFQEKGFSPKATISAAIEEYYNSYWRTKRLPSEPGKFLDGMPGTKNPDDQSSSFEEKTILYE